MEKKGIDEDGGLEGGAWMTSFGQALVCHVTGVTPAFLYSTDTDTHE
jgi:hypothetical protein